MDLLVPFDAVEPKTRLAPVLDADERSAFALAMLRDVLDALRRADREPTVLATAALDAVDATVVVDDRSLDAAVNDRLDGETAVVMADLPLIGPTTVADLFAPDADVVLAPGLGGGTNAFVARHPDFEVDYHGASIRDHRRIAREAGLDVAEVDSRRLATDVDEPADLAELLLHGEGRAVEWLADADVSLSIEGGRVGVERR